VFAGKKSAQIREILISESAWEEMTCLFAPSLTNGHSETVSTNNSNEIKRASLMKIHKMLHSALDIRNYWKSLT
jgi:hypothetical protein